MGNKLQEYIQKIPYSSLFIAAILILKHLTTITITQK
jgi:hypothetical protein